MAGSDSPHGRRHYCTYFDHRYLPSGLALHSSLMEHGDDFTLWVLALDETTARFLEMSARQRLRIVRLTELEAFDPGLKAVKDKRSRVEYYFTCSPALPTILFDRFGLESVTYLDSDLWFFSSPEVLFQELGSGSVALVPHRFSPAALRSHGQFGRFNVGWLTFRNDNDGRACLDWWHERCLEWCYDRLEGDRYADQKYLERFEELFPGVVSLAHPGANLAPWNVGRHHIEAGKPGVRIDRQPLVFFHFQGLRRVGRGVWDSNLTAYGARMTEVLREAVFRPYIESLSNAERLVECALPGVSREGIRRADLGIFHRLASRAWRTSRAAIAGNLVFQ